MLLLLPASPLLHPSLPFPPQFLQCTVFGKASQRGLAYGGWGQCWAQAGGGGQPLPEPASQQQDQQQHPDDHDNGQVLAQQRLVVQVFCFDRKLPRVL